MVDNTIIINNAKFGLEKIWRKTKNDKSIDANKNTYPYPVEGSDWGDRKMFIDKLQLVDNVLDELGLFIKYDVPLDCLLCSQKSITTKRYIYKNTIWEDGLLHYIDVHKIEPSVEFKTLIYTNTLNKQLLARSKRQKHNKNLKILAKKFQKHNEKYIKIEKNQLLILDALMINGGYNKKYYSDVDRTFKFSEHSGMLDFSQSELTKIIVSCYKSRIDKEDDDIYMPNEEIHDMANYEYIFHTHPPTPKPGGRVKDDILYEFPSFGDILHFVTYHNEGNIIGSLVVTPEGLYNIRRTTQHVRKINIDEDKLYDAYNEVFADVQLKAIAKYGKKFSTQTFFSKIAQNHTFINEMNSVLNKFELNIDFYSRKKNKKKEWILDDVFLVFRKNKLRRL